MKIVEFVNGLGLGGTEKAACRWTRSLKELGHEVSLMTLENGPRREELEKHNVPLFVTGESSSEIASALTWLKPDVMHVHAPGQAHEGDILGEALRAMPKIPVVQTNIFGKMQNTEEDAWTDFRLFIAWTGAVQAARRSFRRLDRNFFRKASVAVYPLDPLDPVLSEQVQAFRQKLGIRGGEVVFGRLARPSIGKWTNLALDAFQLALKRNRNIKLLLREPPPEIAATLRSSPDAEHFVILPATLDAEELRLTMCAFDVVLHTSSTGESFGYGIAEPMNLGKPVITHSVPWLDQAQIELVRHGECGFVASTPEVMAEAMLRLAGDATLRQKMGEAAQSHVRRLSDPAVSIGRLEVILKAAIEKRDNPYAAEDFSRALATAEYLDEHEFGHSWREQLALRPRYYIMRQHEFRLALRNRLRRRRTRAG